MASNCSTSTVTEEASECVDEAQKKKSRSLRPSRKKKSSSLQPVQKSGRRRRRARSTGSEETSTRQSSLTQLIARRGSEVDVEMSTAKPRSCSAVETAPLTRSQATVPLDLSTARLSADQLGYYHGWLPREDVDDMLKRKGQFVVRLSDADGQRERVVISVRWLGVVRHFVVQQNKQQQFFVDKRTFASLEELVEFHKTTCTPLSDGDGGPLLQTPLDRRDWQLMHNQIVLQEKLGDGAYGEVFRGLLQQSVGGLRQVAIKVHRTAAGAMTRDERLTFLSEARLMRDWEHANIVRLWGVAAQQDPFMIVLEYAPNGSLLGRLRSAGAALALAERMRYCVHVANGMRYLASKKCIHRDLATRNCLIGEGLVVKVADFGLSCRDERFKGALTDRMPIKWLARESLTRRVYTSKSDVWGFGVLLWEVFSDGAAPYPGMTNQTVRVQVISNGYRMSAPANTPREVAALMQLCWAKRPKDRPNFRSLYKTLKRISNRL